MASAVALAAPPKGGPAQGRHGELSFRGCVSALARGGCAALPAGSLTGASGIAVSPDGRNVYATSYTGDTVTAFTRAGRGRLRFLGCIADAGLGGCQAGPGEALRGASGIAVSPGGGDVYVASGLGSSVTRLTRAAGGQLAFSGCASDRAASGCAPLPFGALAGATGIAVGPGGEDVYVVSTDASTVSHLVPTAAGGLELRDCLSGGEVPGCHQTRRNVLGGAAGVAVSPDGREVYVASYTSGALVRFHRTGSGALRFRGCISDGGNDGCRPLPAGSLSGATGMAISPTGHDVYVSSQVGVVTRLHPSGRRGLEFVSCLAAKRLKGCGRGPGLAQATGIALSPNGADLYVTAQAANAIVHLRPGTRGALVPADCLAARASKGCRKVAPSALRGAYAVATAPDGRSVYATASRGRSVAAFAIRP